MHRWFAVLALALTLAVAAGCSDKNNPTGTPQGTLRMQMTDAPATYDAVRLVVKEVSVHRAGSDSTNGWEVVSTDSTTFDLIQLSNGVLKPMGTVVLPAGNYNQVRLKLDAGSTIVVDGVTYPLTVPSGMQSGLKLNGAFDVPPGGLVDLVLDFDAQRSIVQTGAGVYLLTPVVRVQVLANAGSIKGRLLPDTVTANVWAWTPSGETLGHAIPASDGRFTLAVLPVGTYTVAVRPVFSFGDTTILNVSVAASTVTDLGDIPLSPTAAASSPVSVRVRPNAMTGRSR